VAVPQLYPPMLIGVKPENVLSRAGVLYLILLPRKDFFMPIYTRTGDKGTTALFDGTRVAKSHERVETYASIDELNSIIGETLAFLPKGKYKDVAKDLEHVQHDLFAIGSALAMPHPIPISGLEKRPKEFEAQIDTLTHKLPELKNFILPGGSKAGSLLHVARTFARRAERKVVKLTEKEEVDQDILIYLNRLSDLLFTLARYINHQEKQKEIKWIKR
jgi:cob(I)alamin adenosyltransferase